MFWSFILFGSRAAASQTTTCSQHQPRSSSARRSPSWRTVVSRGASTSTTGWAAPRGAVQATQTRVTATSQARALSERKKNSAESTSVYSTTSIHRHWQWRSFVLRSWPPRTSAEPQTRTSRSRSFQTNDTRWRRTSREKISTHVGTKSSHSKVSLYSNCRQQSAVNSSRQTTGCLLYGTWLCVLKWVAE